MSNLQPPENWRDIVPRQPWATHLGELEAVSVNTPAAGAELSYSPAGGAWERLEFLCVRLAASAAAGTRTPQLLVLDGNARVLLRMPSSVQVATGGTVVFSWARLLGASISLGSAAGSNGMPEIILRPGWSLATLTANIQAGDQYSAGMVTVTRYSDADPTLLEQASRRRRRPR